MGAAIVGAMQMAVTRPAKHFNVWRNPRARIFPPDHPSSARAIFLPHVQRDDAFQNYVLFRYNELERLLSRYGRVSRANVALHGTKSL
jgi:hypothetical protein